MKQKLLLPIFILFMLPFSSSSQEAMLAEVRLFAGNFAPRGWAFCHGQLLPINQYTALFSLLGTTYGGDGRTTFALPDLRGRVPAGTGNGPGLSPLNLGEKKGAETSTLTQNQLASHLHPITGISEITLKTNPNDKGDARVLVLPSTPGSTPVTGLNTQSAGGSQSANNMQPTLGLNYIIALVGIFPSRS